MRVMRKTGIIRLRQIEDVNAERYTLRMSGIYLSSETA